MPIARATAPLAWFCTAMRSKSPVQAADPRRRGSRVAVEVRMTVIGGATHRQRRPRRPCSMPYALDGCRHRVSVSRCFQSWGDGRVVGRGIRRCTTTRNECPQTEPCRRGHGSWSSPSPSGGTTSFRDRRTHRAIEASSDPRAERRTAKIWQTPRSTHSDADRPPRTSIIDDR